MAISEKKKDRLEKRTARYDQYCEIGWMRKTLYGSFVFVLATAIFGALSSIGYIAIDMPWMREHLAGEPWTAYLTELLPGVGIILGCLAVAAFMMFFLKNLSAANKRRLARLKGDTPDFADSKEFKVSGRTAKLADYYKKCLSKKCTDMSDPDQLLTAKVIASDMKLKYPKDSKMVEFLAEARVAYGEAAEKNKRAGEERKKQQDYYAKKSEETKKQQAVMGKLFITVKTGGEDPICVFRRPDGSVYFSIGDSTEKTERAPKFTLEHSASLNYKYNPAELVYTGATVGGVTTGGVSVREASITQSAIKSKNGYITCEGNIVSEIAVEKSVIEDFKRSKEFGSVVSGGIIKCKSAVDEAISNLAMSAIRNGSEINAIQAISYGADKSRFSYERCQKIFAVIMDIVNDNHPKSDEEFYAEAVRLIEEGDLYCLDKAVEILEKIKDYKDSDKQLDRAKKLRVLAKDKGKSKKKIIAVLIAIAVCALLYLLFPIIRNLFLNYLKWW